MQTMRDIINRLTEAAGVPTVPAEPGSEPIPQGMMRRFHVTDVKNLESIRQHGLRMENAQGIEGPKAVYSWQDWKAAEDYGFQRGFGIVEFWDDPAHYDSNRFATTVSVPPSRIIAIHLPWHGHYRYAIENDLSAADLREVGYPEYTQAAEALEAHRGW